MGVAASGLGRQETCAAPLVPAGRNLLLPPTQGWMVLDTLPFPHTRHGDRPERYEDGGQVSDSKLT